MFKFCYTGHLKIFFILLTKVIISYIQVSMVEFRIFGLKKFIRECKICLIIFLAPNKEF